MKGRVLAIGDDRRLLLTRVNVLNTRWFATMASSEHALTLLKEEPFDILVLCHSVSSREAISLVSSVQRDFPKVLILALEKLRGITSIPGFMRDYSFIGGPIKDARCDRKIAWRR